MSKTRSYQGYKVSPEISGGTDDSLTVEEALQIDINGQSFSVTMQTPGDEIALALGLLHSEGLIDYLHLPVVEEVHHNTFGHLIHVDVLLADMDTENLVNRRSLLSVASCGICGSKTLDFAQGEQLIDHQEILSERIHSLFSTMRRGQDAFDESGGCHAAAAFDLGGELLVLKEDVGRHNAVDKVVGTLLQENNLKRAHFLLVSGRISYEIVAKSFKAKIPILAAVSAPSSLAVDFAKELGVTLLAFCRQNRFTIYSHPERIKDAI